MVAQLTGISMALNGNRSHGYQHRPWCAVEHRPRHDPQLQPWPKCHQGPGKPTSLVCLLLTTFTMAPGGKQACSICLLFVSSFLPLSKAHKLFYVTLSPISPSHSSSSWSDHLPTHEMPGRPVDVIPPVRALRAPPGLWLASPLQAELHQGSPSCLSTSQDIEDPSWLALHLEAEMHQKSRFWGCSSSGRPHTLEHTGCTVSGL